MDGERERETGMKAGGEGGEKRVGDKGARRPAERELQCSWAPWAGRLALFQLFSVFKQPECLTLQPGGWRAPKPAWTPAGGVARAQTQERARPHAPRLCARSPQKMLRTAQSVRGPTPVARPVRVAVTSAARARVGAARATARSQAGVGFMVFFFLDAARAKNLRVSTLAARLSPTPHTSFLILFSPKSTRLHGPHPRHRHR